MILHGNFILDNDNIGKFLFWGEDGKTKSRSKKKTGPEVLPLYENMATYDEVGQLLSSNYTKAKAGIYSFAHENQEEPGIIRNMEKGQLIKKEIRGIFVSPLNTLDILGGIEDEVKENTEIKLSEELVYWIAASKFATELIIKHQYYPDIDQDKAHFVAKWKWYSTNTQDTERKNILCEYMPPICKAYFSFGNKSEDFNYKSSDLLLDSFLNWLVDGVVKASVAEEPQKLNISGELIDRWLSALTLINGHLPVIKEDGIKLTDIIKKWLEPLYKKRNNADFRTCFRINAPEEADKPWNLEYVLQSNEDLSLVLPAGEVWKQSKANIKFLNKIFNNPQERLLEDLGVASRMFLPIEKTLYTAKPTHCTLNLSEVYSFLNQEVYLLEDSGFGIIAPSWWKSASKLSVKLKSKNSEKGLGDSRFGLNSIMEYDWKVAIGDLPLSEEDLRQLAKLKIPIVNLRGQWIQLSPEQISAFGRLLNGRSQNMSIGELLRLELSEEKYYQDIKLEDIEASSAVASFVKALSTMEGINQLKAPGDFSGTLRKYQEIGLTWLAYLREHNMGACLADDMGLGKTIQAICLLIYERERKWTDKPTLLICPTSVVGNWAKEILKFAPKLRVMVHHGSDRLDKEAFRIEAMVADVVITTYALSVRDIEKIDSLDWSGIILDEAQNIKNNSTKQTQCIKGIKAQYRIVLTGTPVENRLSDLWSIMDFLNPGYLFNWSTFKTKYALPIEKYKNDEKSKELRKIINPFILRRVKTDPNIIQDLPEKNEMKVYTNLTKEQVTLYEAVVEDMMDKVENSEGIERKGLVLSVLTKLKQVCNHPVQLLKDQSTLEGRSGKLERLLGMLEEVIAEGDRALVFTQFAEMGEMLKQVIQSKLSVKTMFLHGGVQRKKREEMVDAFQMDGEEPIVFILSLKAGGVGLNLTKASHVFHFDRWWNPAVENQATDRAFRIGQKKNVQVHKFICLGTLEEKIDEMLEAKKALADNIIGSGENWITEMSNAELKSMVTLSNVEVMED